MIGMPPVAVYPIRDLAHEDDAVSPTAKSTDASKLALPLPFAATMIGLALAAAGGVWRIDGKVGSIETAIRYEREKDAERLTHQAERDADFRRYIDQRFETLDAKIDASGMRNANMQLAQELSKQKGR